ncbi:hypothetical protein DSO57_1033224 [Entomophthora muscae]|uniref:Uncharacterized protein n=1 Tax=Entomophthora muscae TaxID=34485 RepID=A0ACC2TYQ8_9FUNG|nr:hypothetical protein DSO57_1033224 [Entomophthora muscae]
MKPPLIPRPTIPAPPNLDAAVQRSQLLGALYLPLTGSINWFCLAGGCTMGVAGKALPFLVKLGLIVWWAMSGPASPLPDGAVQYSWYPDSRPIGCHGCTADQF